jgi:hypothetical protein
MSLASFMPPPPPYEPGAPPQPRPPKAAPKFALPRPIKASQHGATRSPCARQLPGVSKPSYDNTWGARGGVEGSGDESKTRPGGHGLDHIFEQAGTGLSFRSPERLWLGQGRIWSSATGYHSALPTSSRAATMSGRITGLFVVIFLNFARTLYMGRAPLQAQAILYFLPPSSPIPLRTASAQETKFFFVVTGIYQGGDEVRCQSRHA